jgi:hypothetical protein
MAEPPDGVAEPSEAPPSDRRLSVADVMALRKAVAVAYDQLRQTVAAFDQLLTVCDQALAVARRPSRPAKAQAARGAIDHRIKDILMEFDERWHRHYGKPYYRVSGGEEARAAATLVNVPPERLSKWMARYFQTDRPYILERRHPFLLFVRTINEYRSKMTPPGEADAGSISVAQTDAYLSRLNGSSHD